MIKSKHQLKELNMLNQSSASQRLLLRILKAGDKSVTSLIKLCYLIDLIAVRELGRQISNFEYIRYNYGPFDKYIYTDLLEMQCNDRIRSCNQYSNVGGDGEHIILYGLKEEFDADDEFSESEINIIDKVLESLNGYGPKYLTELAYKTNPMVAFGATLGGNEHMGEKLNMNA
jgi:hypothetical protein